MTMLLVAALCQILQRRRFQLIWILHARTQWKRIMWQWALPKAMPHGMLWDACGPDKGQR